MKTDAVKTKEFNPLTEGPILKPLMKFTMPIFASLLLQAAYGAADMYIIGRFTDSVQVSAVGSAGIVTAMFMNFIVGIVTGVTVLVGNRYGARKYDEAGKTAGESVFFGIILALIFTIVPLLLLSQIRSLMNVPDAACEAFTQYLAICCAGSVFTVAYNQIAAIYRAVGNSKSPLLFVGIACIVNIIGDCILIAKFEMGAAGAAIATVFAQALSVLFSLIYMKLKGFPFEIKKEMIKFNGNTVSSMFKTGFPIAFQASITTLSFLVLTSIINIRGIAVSAGYGIGQKITVFVTLPQKAFAPALASIVAQNIGAKKPERAKKILFTGCAAAFAIGVLLIAIAWPLAKTISGWFIKDNAEAVLASSQFIHGFCFDNLVGSIVFCFTGYYNGIRKSRIVMAQGIVTAALVRAPLGIIFGKLAWTTLFHFGITTPIASLVGLIMYVIYYVYTSKQSDITDLSQA